MGLTEDVSAIIYTTPLFLKQEFGTYKLEAKKITRITLLNETYLVKRIIFQGEIPEYNNCIAVEFHLTDDIRGGGNA